MTFFVLGIKWKKIKTNLWRRRHLQSDRSHWCRRRFPIIRMIFSNVDQFYWLSCEDDQQTKEPPGHCRWLDSPQRSFCSPFPPHWRQERVGGLVQEEILLVHHLWAQWAETWWHRCLGRWISCLESPGQKNFEKREVFPTLAEPNKSTMNSSDGQSPDFLNREMSKRVCARRFEYRCMKNIWNCNQSINYHLCRLGQKWWQKHEKQEECPPVAESCTHNSFALQNKPHHPPFLPLLLLLLLIPHLLFHNQGSSLPNNLLLSHPHHAHLLLVYHTQLLFACLAPHVNLWRQLSVWVFKRCSPGLRCPTLCTPPSSQKSKFRSKCTPLLYS